MKAASLAFVAVLLTASIAMAGDRPDRPAGIQEKEDPWRSATASNR